MDYSKLSDFEINSAVAKALGLSVSTSHSSIAPWVYCGHDEDGGYGWGERDYCNNPADAWPIIVGNRIALHPLHPVYENEWRASAEDDCGFIGCSSSNLSPLRAAMIVFLMMKDAENGL